MASSFSLAQLIVARLVLGFGSGGYTTTIPVWRSEISGAEHRGAFVNAESRVSCSRSCLTLASMLLLATTVSWHFPFAIQIVLLLAVMAFIFKLPESPRWLVKKGRLEDASEVLAVLNDLSRDDEGIKSDIVTMQQSLAANSAETGFLRSLLRMDEQRIFNHTMIAVLGQLFQQICGCSVTVAYATAIYEQDLGVSAVKSRGLAIVMEILLTVGGAGTVVTADRFGRRPLMLLWATVMAICIAALAGTTSIPNNTNAIYAATLDPPICRRTLEFRPAIAAGSTATSWLSNFVVVLVPLVGFNNTGYRYWIVYAVINAVIIPTVYFVFPETTSLHLEEIHEVFSRSKSIFDLPKIARAMTKMRAGFTDESGAGEKIDKILR